MLPLTLLTIWFNDWQQRIDDSFQYLQKSLVSVDGLNKKFKADCSIQIINKFTMDMSIEVQHDI
jgi:hypothetical protein